MKRLNLKTMNEQNEMEKLHNTVFEMLKVIREKYKGKFPDQSSIILMNLEKVSTEMNSIRLKIISGNTNEEK